MTAHPLDTAIQQLINARKALGWPQLIAEEKIGCSAGLLPKYETRRKNPSLFGLIMWAEALGHDIVLRSSTVIDGGQVANDIRGALDTLNQAGIEVVAVPRTANLLDGGILAIGSLMKASVAAQRLSDMLLDIDSRLPRASST